MLLDEGLEDLGTFKIGGRVIRLGKYADDLVLIVSTVEELQKMIDQLVEAGKNYGIEINVEKSKVMAISKEKKDV